MRWVLRGGLDGHPFVLPVFGLCCVLVGARWLAGRMSGRPADPAWLAFWLALGLLVSVTLTPAGQDPSHPRWCLPQWPRTGFGLWAANPERRWNVLLGVPLGLAAGWCLARRRSLPALAAVAGALLVPDLIELGQAVLPLGRICALLDVVDNTSGVLIGLAVAALGALVHAAARGAARR